MLEHQVASAEQLVDASTKEYVDLLEGMLKNGPQAGAMGWLRTQVTQKVAHRLQEAGLGRAAARELANRLIPRVGEGAVRTRRAFEDQVMNELATL